MIQKALLCQFLCIGDGVATEVTYDLSSDPFVVLGGQASGLGGVAAVYPCAAQNADASPAGAEALNPSIVASLAPGKHPMLTLTFPTAPSGPTFTPVLLTY